MNNRLVAVVDKIVKGQLDAILITDPKTIAYLIGYHNHPGERFYGLVVTKTGKLTLIMNRLFYLDMKLDLEIVWYDDTDALASVVSPVFNKLTRIGVDKDLPARFLLELQTVFDEIHFTLGSSCVDEVRMVKDETEIEKMVIASKINDQAMELLAREIATGAYSEVELKDKLDEIYRELGSDGFSFEPIIAFGHNGANPHHELDSSTLKRGDSIVVDIGCRYQDYCSDMTRTFFFEAVEPTHRKIYEIVKEANLKAQAMIKPGVKLKEIDAVAREYIEAAGYGEYFNHRLGHFIGRDVHEYGDVSASFETEVTPGMIFSIEPGIYLKDELGVRIEDLVLVTQEGAVSLNGFSKELIILKER